MRRGERQLSGGGLLSEGLAAFLRVSVSEHAKKMTSRCNSTECDIDKRTQGVGTQALWQGNRWGCASGGVANYDDAFATDAPLKKGHQLGKGNL